MFRIIFIVILLMLAVPFFNKAKDYVSQKTQTVKEVGKDVGRYLKR